MGILVSSIVTLSLMFSKSRLGIASIMGNLKAQEQAQQVEEPVLKQATVESSF